MALGGTSGAYNFNPATGEIVGYAFNMIGIRPAALLQEHMQSARMAANLLMGRFSALTPNLWSVDLQTIPLVPGQKTYDIPVNTITMLDAYVVQNSGGATVNRIILPISRSEYASYPQPDQSGQVTVFWYDRLLSPTVTLYYVPDDSQSELQYYRVRQAMDTNYTSGQQLELPVYWLEAFATGLAYRLALIWSPEKAAGLKAFADESYEIAANQNVEASSVYISPMISSYFRA